MAFQCMIFLCGKCRAMNTCPLSDVRVVILGQVLVSNPSLLCPFCNCNSVLAVDTQGFMCLVSPWGDTSVAAYIMQGQQCKASPTNHHMSICGIAAERVTLLLVIAEHRKPTHSQAPLCKPIAYALYELPPVLDKPLVHAGTQDEQ